VQGEKQENYSGDLPLKKIKDRKRQIQKQIKKKRPRRKAPDKPLSVGDRSRAALDEKRKLEEAKQRINELCVSCKLLFNPCKGHKAWYVIIKCPDYQPIGEENAKSEKKSKRKSV
jgi:hypothetical protein